MPKTRKNAIFDAKKAEQRDVRRPKKQTTVIFDAKRAKNAILGRRLAPFSDHSGTSFCQQMMKISANKSARRAESISDGFMAGSLQSISVFDENQTFQKIKNLKNRRRYNLY